MFHLGNVNVNVVVDVNGWLKMPSGFTPVTPTRVFDTRSGTPTALRAVTKQQVGPTSPLKVKLADLPGGLVPASGVAHCDCHEFGPEWVRHGHTVWRCG